MHYLYTPVSSLQMRPILKRPSPPLLLLTLTQALGLLTAQPSRRASLLLLGLSLHGLVKELLAQLVRELDDARADCGAVAAVLALATARRDLFRKVPQPARGH